VVLVAVLVVTAITLLALQVQADKVMLVVQAQTEAVVVEAAVAGKTQQEWLLAQADKVEMV
jgi:hypothetical protein